MSLKLSDIDGIGKKLDELVKVVNGGRGSGNFNPGQGRGVGKPGNGMSTKSDRMLYDTVKQMADIFSTMNKREGYKYSSSEDLVLKQGKFFTPEKKPDDIKLGPKKECFANASKLALERSNLIYVEGYAMVNDRLPLPIAHAWCVDKKGRVVDNTWENPGVAYFGVPFKTSYLAKKLSETGVYGILSGSVGSSDFLKDGVPSEGIANIKKQKNAIVVNGGEGSGNFGHKGRIGKVGGSSKDGSGSKIEFSEMLSKDAKKVLGEVNEYSEGTYFKEINSVLNDFSKLGVDVKKVKFETNVDKLPEKMKKQITDSTEGMISAKKNLEAVIYLDETKQSEYGLGGENKFLEGREPKDQPWATNNSPIGILRHELGHLAAYTVFMNSRGRKGTAGPILGGAVNLETHANLKKIFGEGYALNRLKLSRYGMKDSGEAVAESFANPNFSSDTKKIYDFYVNELKKKSQNNAVEDDGWLVLCLGFTTKDPLSNKVNQLIHKINEVTGKGYNPYRDEKGRFASGPSGEKSESGESLKIRMDGEEYTSKGFKKKTQEQNEAYVLDEISDNYEDLVGLEKRVMENKGWNVYEEGGQAYGELDAKVTKQALSLGKDDVQVMNNGKKYLEDDNDEFYRSKPSDADGFAIYTTDNHKSALDYADGKEGAICYLVIDKSNFISQKDIDAVRSRLIKNAKTKGLKEVLRKTNKTAQVKDTVIAAMLGYDGIIRPTGDSGNEYIVINPELLRLDKIKK